MAAPLRTKISESKKALFLCAAFVQLNIILFASLFWPSLAASEYLNALILLVSFYFGAEGGNDIARTIVSKNAKKQE